MLTGFNPGDAWALKPSPCRAEALAVVPLSMDQLAELVNLHRRLLDERKKTEARFEPLRCALGPKPYRRMRPACALAPASVLGKASDSAQAAGWCALGRGPRTLALP